MSETIKRHIAFEAVVKQCDRAHQEQRRCQLAMQGLADALENFVACSCLYYHSHSLNEFAKPIKQARAALDAAKPFLTGT